jgi:hypothetical protein
MPPRRHRLLSAAPALLLALIPLTAPAQNMFDTDAPRRLSPPPPTTENPIGAARNHALGKIVWVDGTGRRAIAWLDQPHLLNPIHSLGTRTPALEPRALLRLIRQNAHSPQTVGLIVERGEARVGQILIRPDDATAERLLRFPPRPDPTAPMPATAPIPATAPTAPDNKPSTTTLNTPS